MFARLASVLLVVAACSSGTPAKVPNPQPEVVSAKPLIEINDLTVRFDGMPIARLHPDGRSESVGNNPPSANPTFVPGPTFRADGTIELTKAGFKARVEPDGEIYVVPPANAGQQEQLFGRITGDQLVMQGAEKGGVRLDGATLTMFHEGKTTNVIGVVEPPAMGRTALLMTAAFFIDMAITSR